jgi:hypothetical protein
MRLLRELFLQHTALKLISLVIALALWTAYVSEPMVETGFNAPILLLNVPPGLQLAGDPPPTAVLRLRGRSGAMQRLDPRGITVSADCRNTAAGTQFVRLTPNVTAGPNTAEVLSIAPARIEISLVPASAPPPARN